MEKPHGKIWGNGGKDHEDGGDKSLKGLFTYPVLI